VQGPQLLNLEDGPADIRMEAPRLGGGRRAAPGTYFARHLASIAVFAFVLSRSILGCFCRIPTYPLDLLAYAWKHRDWVEDVEQRLANFIVGRAQREKLSPMPKTQRALVAKLAGEYGLTTVSHGTEPNRFVELYKVQQ
jgi:predicted RNA-binding protein Jag